MITRIDGKKMDSFPRLKCLLPETCNSEAADMAERLDVLNRYPYR
jgi:hypothetical protein